jgi:hypothetical protein
MNNTYPTIRKYSKDFHDGVAFTKEASRKIVETMRVHSPSSEKVYHATCFAIKIITMTYAMYQYPVITGTAGAFATVGSHWLKTTKISSSRSYIQNNLLDKPALLKTDKKTRFAASIAFNFSLLGVVAVLGTGFYLIRNGKYISDRDYQTFAIPLVFALSILGLHRDISRELTSYNQESDRAHLKLSLQAENPKQVIDIDSVWRDEVRHYDHIKKYHEKKKIWILNAAETQINEFGTEKIENWAYNLAMRVIEEEIKEPFFADNENCPTSLIMHTQHIRLLKAHKDDPNSLSGTNYGNPEKIKETLAKRMAERDLDVLNEIRDHVIERYYLKKLWLPSYIKYQWNKAKQMWQIFNNSTSINIVVKAPSPTPKSPIFKSTLDLTKANSYSGHDSTNR